MKNLLFFSKSGFLLAMLFWFTFPVNALAQQNIVSGTVADPQGEPLPGVNVIIKGTTNGTITDFEGKYSIGISDQEATLVFTFIGYQTLEEPLNGRSTIDVSMVEDIKALQEVVVVGYGTQKKVNLSGAVDQVDKKALEDRPIQTIAQGLQGTVPNLNIDFLSGEPGAAPQINIRGFTSINGGQPLVLVDNVPTDPEELNLIAPADVESISVLKDASAAAIYGARASFGVILITTKNGANEKMKVNYTNNLNWARPTVIPDKVTDPYIYLRWRETSTDNTPWDNQNYSDERYQWARERSDDPSIPGVRVNPNDPTSWEYMGNQDWTEYFLSESTFSQNHNLALSGGSENANYYLSAGYDSQTGALKIADDKFDRYMFRAKVNYTPNEWLTIGNNTSYTASQRLKPSNLSLWELYNFHPTDFDKNPDGTWANNPVGRMGAALTDGGDSDNRNNMIQSTFSAQASLFDDMLKLNADYTFRRQDQNYNWFQTRYNIGFGPDDVREEGLNEAWRRASFENYNVFNLYGTFQKTFGSRHHVQAIVGYNQEYNRYEQITAQRDNVISASLPTIALATGDPLVDEDIWDWAVRGAFYRLNYTFDEKYIVELNGRYDGSSRFPKEKRFGFFPSASAAWVISKENFWEGLDNTVNFFKLRASYGSLGNQFVSPYGYISTMASQRGSYLIGGQIPQTVTTPPLVSSNYTWEEVSSLNFGVDLGFLAHRLTASFDIFTRTTAGMLTLGKDLPDVLGASEPMENAADLETKGWELSLGYNDDIMVFGKPMNINASFVLADNRSYITSFDNPNQNLTQFYEGQELGEIWGLTSDGLFRSEDEIEALDQSSIIPWGALSIVEGWPKYKDLDGNGAIEKGFTVDDPKDLSVIGNSLPRMRFGFNLGFNYEGFDFRAFLQGVGQRDFYPLHYLYWGFYQQPYYGGYRHLLDYYRAAPDSEIEMAQHSQAYIDAGLADANTDAYFPVLQAWLADRNLGERIDQAQGLAIPQTRYLQNGAYLRVKNITLGYTLPQSLLESLGVGNIRLFVSGENLFEFSPIKDFFDPEAITDNTETVNPSAQTSAGWGYVYPFQRRYSFGINVQF